MPRIIETTIAGIELTLLGDRGVYWNAQQTLLIADTHFGKEATFRRHGVPVPRGSTIGTLKTIAQMLDRTEAKRMVILGDMFHARSSLSRDVCESLDAFMNRYGNIEFTLVRGNHDAQVGQLPDRWPIEVIESGKIEDGIALAHHPGAKPDDAELLMCGHLHPSIQFKSATDRVGKLPCFWLHEGCLVLPAVGEFTGTHHIPLGNKDRAWIVLEDELLEYQTQ
jgi:DNA ligase-associated metallophosphoesterase